MGAKKAVCTKRAYASGWKAFEYFCNEAGREVLPTTPSNVSDFVVWCINQGLRLATVEVRLNAIGHYHREAGLSSPVDKSVRGLLANARRELKEAPGGKAALSYDMLTRLVGKLSTSEALDVRNRAMILVGFSAGWRRSEVVALQFADVSFEPEGMTLFQLSSKTDQEAESRLVGIQPGKRLATCPVRALQRWIELRGSWEGPLFTRLTPGHRITRKPLHARGETLHLAIKRGTRLIGEDPSRFGAHSLRAGMVTEAARHGACEAAIKARTGHKSSEVLQQYIRPARVFEFNPLAQVL